MEYFILKPDGEQTGTFSLDQIRAMLNSGIIGVDTRYWHEGISEWQPIERIEESTDFPEPDPHQPHTPPPHQWSGSLARAIPSPQQQKRAVAAQPATPSAPPAPAVPEPQRPVAEIPDAFEHHGSAANGIARRTALARELAAAAPRRRFRLPRFPRPSTGQVYTFCSIFLALAIIAAVIASRHPAKSVFSQVTLTSRNDCVLLDQATIKPFVTDMENVSPTAARLKGVIALSTDSAFVETASTGLQDEIVRHEVETTRRYLRFGKAVVLEPGPYRVVAYLDDNGTLVPAHAGAPWAAILDHGSVVYAYLGHDFQPRPQ